jgi:NAD(P)-dependent dehydrogenase (short-subunit alcohol dehydrogenase family)
VKSFAKCGPRGLAFELAAGGSGEIGDLKLGLGPREPLGDEGQSIPALLFQSDDFTRQVAPRIPRLKDQTSIPFRKAPLIGHQRERLFARIEQSGFCGRGNKAFDKTLEGLGHALSVWQMWAMGYLCRRMRGLYSLERVTMTSNGRVALVTGAGSGIGRAVSLALQSSGYAVVLAGRRAAELERTAASAVPNGAQMLPVATDVSSQESVRALFARVQEAFGRLDVLFNNAGIGGRAVPLEDLTLEQWNAVVAVNLTGAFLCAQEAIRLMKAQQPRGGRIINNGSLSAYSPRPNSAPYTSTKHALTGLTKCISLDGRKCDIACSQIDVGNAATEMTEKMSAGVRQANGTKMPEPRMDVRHVAEAVVFMANLPLDANVQFMTVMATAMPFIGRG